MFNKNKELSGQELYVSKALGENHYVAEALSVMARVDVMSRVNGPSLGVITPSNEYARALSAALSNLSNERLPVQFFPARDVLPFEEKDESVALIAERIRTLYLLSKKDIAQKVLLAPLSVFFEMHEEVSSLLSRSLSLSLNQEFDREDLIEYLESHGYTRGSRVEKVGEYVCQSHIVDIFSPSQVYPIRVEIVLGKVRSLRFFDSESQRSLKGVDALASVDIVPLSLVRVPREEPLRYFSECLLPAVLKHAETVEVPSRELKMKQEKLLQGVLWQGLDYFSIAEDKSSVSFSKLFPSIQQWMCAGSDSIQDLIASWSEVILREDKRREEQHILLPPAKSFFLPEADVRRMCEETCSLQLYDEDASQGAISLFKAAPEIRVDSLTHSESLFDKLMSYLSEEVARNKKIILAVSSEGKAEVLYKGLKESSVTVRRSDMSVVEAIGAIQSGEVLIVNAHLDSGCCLPSTGLLLFSDTELFHTHRPVLSKKPVFRSSPYRRKVSSLSQLEIDDFVVHEQYGIGCFRGMRVLSRPEGRGEYLHIEYAQGAKLFVPLHDFLKVGKYYSSSDATPELTVLGSEKWNQVKTKIQNEIAHLTGRLLKTIAARSVVTRPSFGQLNSDDRYFAEQFQFQETKDQAKTIDEVLADLGSEKPMDRLVCGDVGFGKTEVALRASFKVASGGKQVAVLAPTTLLAEQHLKTFSDRFVETGIRVASLTRFCSRKEVEHTLTDLKSGALDVVIGTHRILQNDVHFHDLGMLVIDEEHRFGVKQKERLRDLRSSIDVLSLSATPIPRSLQLALYGTKDLSVIETAPFNRQPIITTARQFTEEVLITALRSEVKRGGQVFVVQHFIEGLEEVKDLIRDLDPSLRVGLAHGQIKKNELEKVMREFYAGTLDVLVSTAIVESGLDVPNANTIVIIHPEDFGLAQLYQLRGRVGRSQTQAYAYLLHKAEYRMSQDGKRRLRALSRQDSLGMGFQLALQDMEIRGAGTLLGKDQSGHVQKVGFETYKRILEKAIRQERLKRGESETTKEEMTAYAALEPELFFNGDQLIPDAYVPSVSERLVMYQVIVDLATLEAVWSYEEECADRYGPVPEQMINLLWASCLRNLCKKVGISRVTELGDKDDASQRQYEVRFVEENSYAELFRKETLVTEIAPLRYRLKVENFSECVKKIFSSTVTQAS